MRVVIRFHESVRAAYEEWQARLSRPPTGNPGVARLHAEELIRQLRDSDGLPEGAHFHPELDPPSWVWRFATDTWVRFTHQQRRVGLWGGRVAEVLVIGVAPHPPG